MNNTNKSDIVVGMCIYIYKYSKAYTNQTDHSVWIFLDCCVLIGAHRSNFELNAFELPQNDMLSYS